ncbi:MAG: DnaB-like helicase C-terminal domain-containing protein [Candidatus Actinomarinaceae bacterium]
MTKKITGVFRAKTLTKDVLALWDGQTHIRHSTGFKDLDDYLRIIKPSFTVWTGTPNSGKSSLTYDIMVRMAKNEGWKWAVFSPEHSLAQNVKRLIEKFLQKPFDNIHKNRCTVDEVIMALDFIHEHFFFIDGVGESPSIDYILERAKYCVDEYKIDGLICDPYNEINPARANLREDEHISLLISKIKRFNRETNTVSFIVAHPSKQIRQADGQFRVSSLYDISGSSHWNNKADVGIIVTRDFEKEQTVVRIAKVREIDVQGNIGEVILKWNTRTRCFHGLNSPVFNSGDF